MNKPFLPLTISFITGILIANQFQLPAIYLFIGLIVGIILLAISIYREKDAFYNILLIFLLLGMLMTNLKSQSKLLNYTDMRMDYMGIVEEVLSLEDDDLHKYVVLVQAELGTGEKINERIRLNIIGASPLSYGDRIVFNGEVKKPLNNTNPILYNHRLNLLSNSIYASMTINEYSMDLIDGPREFKYSLKEGFHEEVNRVFDTYLDRENRAIIKSMILGKSSYMMEEDLQIYRELGLGHILAVSGLHIGIISAFILNILMLFSISRKTSSLITILILFVYGYLIGFPHSMMRGIIMFSLLILTKLLHEHSNPINVLSLSALIVLFINPFALFGLGFLLSYTAVLSLYLFSNRIEALFYPFKGYIAKSLSSIVAVNLGIFPIQAYYFNYISPLGLIANLISIPLLSLSLLLSISMFLLDYTLSFLNVGLSPLLNMLLNIEGIIRNKIYDFSFLIVNTASPSFYSIVLYYLGIAILLRLIDTSKFKIQVKNSILLFICLMIIVNLATIVLNDKLELHFIDVGQGDSMLLRKATRNILIDTGGSLLSDYVGQQISLPYLRKLGIKKLDGVIISHFDADHAGALATLIDNLEIDNIYASYRPEDEVIYEKIKNNKIAFTILKEGDQLRIDKDLIIDTIWPLDTDGLSNNNKSLVLSFNYKGHEILLTGDIEKEAEAMLLDKLNPNIDLVKIPHHGSNTSSTSEFLGLIRPKNSIISVGRDNQFNHPSGEVINRLSAINSKIYRTDEMGMIKVHIDKNLKIEGFIEEEKTLVDFIYINIWNLTFYIIYYIITRKIIIEYEKSGAELYELC